MFRTCSIQKHVHVYIVPCISSACWLLLWVNNRMWNNSSYQTQVGYVAVNKLQSNLHTLWSIYLHLIWCWYAILVLWQWKTECQPFNCSSLNDPLNLIRKGLNWLNIILTVNALWSMDMFLLLSLIIIANELNPRIN